MTFYVFIETWRKTVRISKYHSKFPKLLCSREQVGHSLALSPCCSGCSDREHTYPAVLFNLHLGDKEPLAVTQQQEQELLNHRDLMGLLALQFCLVVCLFITGE